MGELEKVLYKINMQRDCLNKLYKIQLLQRDSNWYLKYQKVTIEYQEGLHQFKFGIMQCDYNYSYNHINTAYSRGLLNKYEYKNLCYNVDNARLRDIHPLIYMMSDDHEVIYQVVKTHSKNLIKKPLDDEILISKKPESMKVYEILKDTYLSESIYLLQLKDKLDLKKIIKNIDNDTDLLDKYFNNKSARLYQKEKVFDMLYKSKFNKEPIMLSENINVIDKDLQVSCAKIPMEISFVDITKNSYIDDNIDLISKYKKYKEESWIEYLKLYELTDEKLNKNDPSDI